MVSVPQTNGFTFISMLTRVAPFDDVRVRKAIALALPYEDMFRASLFARGRRLYGAGWSGQPPDSGFPQPMPMKTDAAQAKLLLTQAGLPDGFDTVFTIAAGQAAVAEPLAALVKESLAGIGIRVEIQKKPDGEFSTLQAQHKLLFYTDNATAWLPGTDYYFRIYFTRDQRSNFAGWNNPEINSLVEAARFERDATVYDQDCERILEVFAREVPLVLLWQPNHDAVMAANMDGYTYQFYRQADFRPLRRV